MKLGYVCTNYNNSHCTREAVRSLSDIAGHQVRAVVVDNNSNSENVEDLQRLAKRLPGVVLILNDENLGYFGGLNLGIRQLRSQFPDTDLVVIGNNDLLFPADFMDCLRRNLSLFEKYPVISPDIVTLDGVHQNPHVVKSISKSREFLYELYNANYYVALGIRALSKLTRSFTDRPDETFHDVAQEIYQGYGACYVLGPLFFHHFEQLWAPTFMLHEEYFLSKQLSDKGFSLFYEPSIEVRHSCHGAMGKVPSRKAWELGRNAHKVYRQHVKIFG